MYLTEIEARGHDRAVIRSWSWRQGLCDPQYTLHCTIYSRDVKIPVRFVTHVCCNKAKEHNVDPTSYEDQSL